MPDGVTQEGQAGCRQREQQDLYQILVGEGCKVSRLSLDGLNPNKKEGILVSLLGVLPEEFVTGRPCGTGENAEHKSCWGSRIRNLHLLVTLQAALQCMCLHEGLVFSLRPPAGFLAKTDAKAAVPWSNSQHCGIFFEISHPLIFFFPYRLQLNTYYCSGINVRDTEMNKTQFLPLKSLQVTNC